MAPNRATRGDGYHGGGDAARSESHIAGHEPSAKRPMTSHTTLAAPTANSRSRAIDQRRRTNVATARSTAGSTGRSARICHAPSKKSGKAERNSETARLNPGAGTAARLTAASASEQPASRTTSLARRERGSSAGVANNRGPRRNTSGRKSGRATSAVVMSGCPSASFSSSGASEPRLVEASRPPGARRPPPPVSHRMVRLVWSPLSSSIDVAPSRRSSSGTRSAVCARRRTARHTSSRCSSR